MKMEPIISSILIAVAIAGSVLVVSTTFSQLQQQANRNTAVDGCLKSSMYRSSKTNADGFAITTEEPIKPAVETCLNLKGY